jgi:hypothetical protein
LDSTFERRNEGALPVLGEDGRALKITLYVTCEVLTGRGGGRASLPSGYTIELDDGSHVERLGASDTFRIADTGETLRLDA